MSKQQNPIIQYTIAEIPLQIDVGNEVSAAITIRITEENAILKNIVRLYRVLDEAEEGYGIEPAQLRGEIAQLIEKHNIQL